MSQSTTTTASSITRPSIIPDPFFGLLNNPPGRWGLIAYGLDKALILQRPKTFLTKALNFLHSYAGGRMNGPTSKLVPVQIKEQDETGAMMIPMSEGRLKRALTVWFYGQLYPYRAQTEDVLDEEGDVVDTNLLNEPDIMDEAERLTSSFYSKIEGDGLGCSFMDKVQTIHLEHTVGTLNDGWTAGRDE